MRFLVPGLVVLSACRLAGESTYVTPLAPPLTPRETDCPVLATPDVPPPHADAQMIAIVRCAAANVHECRAEIRELTCRLGGNYVFGFHIEREGWIGTIAFYNPPKAAADAPSPGPRSKP
jgi:hypothetical protein